MEESFTVKECLLETGLIPGSDVRYTPKNPNNNCMKCGTVLDTSEIDGILLGHVEYNGVVYDGIRPYSPITCPNCGGRIVAYFIRCAKSNEPSLADQLFSSVKFGDNQND